MLALLLISATIAAEPSTVLIVDRADASLLAELAGKERVLSLGGDDDPDVVLANQALTKARAACEAAKQAHFELKNDRATSKFDEAFAAYGRAAIVMTSYTELGDCMLHAGALWSSDDKEERALSLFRQAFVLGAKPNPRVHNPNVVRQYQRVADELKRAAEGNLTVSGSPEGAHVWIDGTERGVLPISVRGLMPGNHWVSVIAPGHERFATQVAVTSNTTARIDAFLQASATARAWQAARSSPLSAEARVLLDRFAAEHDAKRLVFVDLTTGVARIYDGSEDRVRSLPLGAPPERMAPVRAALLEPEKVATSTSAPVTMVSPAPQRQHPVLALIPFGVAQLLQKRPVAGGLILSSEVLLLGLNVSTAIVIAMDRAPDGSYFNARRDQALQIVNYVSFGVLMAELVVAAIDALLHR